MHCIEHGGIKLEYNNTLAGPGLYTLAGRPAGSDCGCGGQQQQQHIKHTAKIRFF
jgi:hypothetical protein